MFETISGQASTEGIPLCNVTFPSSISRADSKDVSSLVVSAVDSEIKLMNQTPGSVAFFLLLYFCGFQKQLPAHDLPRFLT